MSLRLKADGITLKQFYVLSKKYYKLVRGDDKKERAKLDIHQARISYMRNFTYDSSTRSWKSTNVRHVKFEFIVSSKPVSYEKTDTIAIHKYPCVFLLYNIELGLDSPFRFRSGSLKKPMFAPKGCSSEVRTKIANQNIRNGVDMGAVINLYWHLKMNSLLYGPLMVNRAPKIANPKGDIYFDKHSLFCFEKILVPLFNNPSALAKVKKIYKNEDIV